MRSVGERRVLRSTDVADPAHYGAVVGCQWACPTHTDVPGYLRLIGQGRYDEAYLLNRETNVFPGILGRTCDRPCEPACRRARVEGEPVAICRMKRAAADLRGDVRDRLPSARRRPSGRRVAAVGCGPASLTVANDLLPHGYSVTLFERAREPGGLMRSGIPAFRLPAEVLDAEIGAILDMGAHVRYDSPVGSLAALLAEGYDAVFVGSGAPRGKDLALPGRHEGDADTHVHVGLEWLASVAFGHRKAIGERVVVVGVGNAAMDCGRVARRLGGRDVRVVARRPRAFFKASAWELDEAGAEGVEFVVGHAPRRFVVEAGRLRGLELDVLEWDEPAVHSRVVGRAFLPADDVLLAVGQEAAFDWIEPDLGIDFDGGLPVVDPTTMASTRPGVYFGGDAAFGPRNIVSAVAHGHAAAVSIDRSCRAAPTEGALRLGLRLKSQKMGLHQWSYANDYSPAAREAMVEVASERRVGNLAVEVELGFTADQAAREAGRCLNCDVQTVFDHRRCIECGACVDVCPAEALTITRPGTEDEVLSRLTRLRRDPDQPLFVSLPLPQTGRVMVKDENLCAHCGLCAERCPATAWDMAKLELVPARPGAGRGAP